MCRAVYSGSSKEGSMNLKYFNFILVIFCVLAFSACATVPRWNVPAVPSTPEREGPSEEYKAKAMEERIEPPAVNVVKFRPDDVIDEKIIKNFLKRACEVKFPEKANIATLPVFSRPQVRSVQDKTIIVLPETHYKERSFPPPRTLRRLLKRPSRLQHLPSTLK
jgi:hypothetical protein